MERSIKENNFTVQGLDTLVPAALVGEQAGPQSSISNYRNGVEVDPLAPTSSNATRMQNKEGVYDMFRRSSKLTRTPVATHSGNKTPSVQNRNVENPFIGRNTMRRSPSDATKASKPGAVENVNNSPESPRSLRGTLQNLSQNATELMQLLNSQKQVNAMMKNFTASIISLIGEAREISDVECVNTRGNVANGDEKWTQTSPLIRKDIRAKRTLNMEENPPPKRRSNEKVTNAVTEMTTGINTSFNRHNAEWKTVRKK